MFSYEEKIIIELLKKFKCGAKNIVNDHPEYELNVNGVKKLLKKIDETGDVTRKEGSGRSKSVRTEKTLN